ncbi:MAG: hypothetical protein AAFN08_02015, partial [Cyanobacteria bacterium J06559_3]
FELEPVHGTDSANDTIAIAPPYSEKPSHLGNPVAKETPLPIPAAASQPPFAGNSTLPAGVYGGGQALALGDRTSVRTALPAPPPVSINPVVSQEAQHQSTVASRHTQTPTAPTKPAPVEAIDNLLLGFDLAPRAKTPQATPKPAQEAFSSAEIIGQIFQGGVESLVARAVGSAEGTRTPEGHKTPAYFGHLDPGNGVWNLGTFSYQHNARTPEEADTQQLHRLQSQSRSLKQKALAHNITLSLEELLNGIDLANQAPQAALDREGYIEWLAEARRLGMTGPDAIVWARTRSFIDPDTQRWNAPGLGNNIHSISRDQSRRVDAIARAVAARALPADSLTATTTDASPSEVTLSENLGAIDKVLTQTVGVLSSNTQDIIDHSSNTVARNQQNREAAALKPVSFPLEDALPLQSDTSGSAAIAVATNSDSQISTSVEEGFSRNTPIASDALAGEAPAQIAATTDRVTAIRKTPTLSEAFAVPNIHIPPDKLTTHNEADIQLAEPAIDPLSSPNLDFPNNSDKIRPKTP